MDDTPDLTKTHRTFHLVMNPSWNGIRTTGRRLLDLPGGLRFFKVRVDYSGEDAESTNGLLSRCSDSLESFYWGRSTTLPRVD